MAGFDYSEFVDIADELLAEFGQVGSLSRPTFSGPVHSPVPGEPLIYPAIFVLASFRSSEIDGTRVLRSDKKAIIAPSLAVTPELSDLLIEVDGGKFAFVSPVFTLRPATTTIAYIAQVRGSGALA